MMMKQALGFSILALVLVGQGCLADPPQVNRPILFNTASETPLEADPSGIGGANGTSTDDTPPPLKTGEIESASKNVVVTSIVPNQTLPNPFVILGRGRAFENVLNWRVRDNQGTEIATGYVMTEAPDIGLFGAYRVRAFYGRLPDMQSGFVEVYTLSPRDGSEQDMVRIPVKLTTESTAVKAFFANEVEDPGTLHCERVYPVTRRVAKTTSVAEAALLELLDGPSAAEQITGSRTTIVPGTGLKSVIINGGTATVDFDRQFALGIAGSCAVQALRSQVEQTLLQFNGVKTVKILVEGADAENVLQP